MKIAGGLLEGGLRGCAQRKLGVVQLVWELQNGQDCLGPTRRKVLLKILHFRLYRPNIRVLKTGSTS